jgi:hypothetical protein
MNRRELIAAGVASAAGLTLVPGAVRAHHGWSSFDQDRPLYLEGRAARVVWRNPHVELELAIAADLRLPTDLATRTVPSQTAPVDGAGLLRAARLPLRRDPRWEIELAPLTRMNAWKVPEIKPGDALAVLGFTFTGEKGDAVLRAEYLWTAGGVYGLRSSPA